MLMFHRGTTYTHDCIAEHKWLVENDTGNTLNVFGQGDKESREEDSQSIPVVVL